MTTETASPTTGATPPVGASPTPAAGRPVGPTPRERLRRWRGPLLVVALVLLTGLVVALLSATSTRGLLRPDAVDPSGSAALATLLREQGVRIEVARTGNDADLASPGRTVLVAFPARMSTSQRDALARSRADVVLVRPDAATLGRLAPGVTADPAALPEITVPSCALPAAVAAGPVNLESTAYTAPPPAVRCYPSGAAASLVSVPAGGRTVTVVGDTTPFTNDALDERGNAALTMRLLGGHPTLVWYLPVPEPAAPGQQRPLIDLVPAGWLWGAGQLLVAGLVAALWRGRRLGPLVSEPLPVVVRGVETVQGRARLYRRAGARDRAAEALRARARGDLAGAVGLGRGAAPEELAAAVAARTGRTTVAVADLLHDAPGDDRALVALAADLDRVVEDVHRA